MFLNQFPDIEKFRSLAETCNTIPVCAEILADTETPVSLLKKIYPSKGPAFLLESVEGGERWGRYSFLSTSARIQVRIFRDAVEISETGRPERIGHDGDPLPIMRRFMERFHPAELPGLPRFWSGMIGYLTYEMVSFFESIPNRLAPEKPMAHFIVPDELLVFDNIRHTLLCIGVAFLEDHKDPDILYHETWKRVQRLIELCLKPGPEIKTGAQAAPCATLTPVRPEGEYQDHVRTAKDYVRAGDIIQTVVSQPFCCEPPPDLWTLYRAQRYINPSPYLFFLHLDDTALVGSSPETMVRLENGIATLRPIAGTRPRGENEQADRALADELLQDEKERAEHLMLVDLGRNDLGRVAEVGTVQVTDLMIVERYSHVMHLVSNITCYLRREKDAWDLLRATFPAGTLSGAPKIRAMEIIDELEQSPRGPYGGAVGYIAFNGNMDLAITIRTACVEDGVLTVRAGAGLVADSDPKREHQETVNKAMAIQKALELIRFETGKENGSCSS